MKTRTADVLAAAVVLALNMLSPDGCGGAGVSISL
jgi:hypothetical protein